MDAAVVADRLEQAVDRRLELGHVAVAQQVHQQRVLGLRVEPLQRVGVGGVAGLDALGLGQGQLVEQDLLQLLGRAEVELAPDHPVGRLRRRLDLGREVRLQLGQVGRVGGDAGPLHLREHLEQGQLDVVEQPGRKVTLAAQLLGDGVGEVEGRAGAQHEPLLGLGRLALQPFDVEGELAGVGRVDPQLPLEVAQREVVEVVRTLIGAGQVGRERRVAGDAVQRPTAGDEREQRRLDVVQHLGPVRGGEPGRDGLLVGLVELGRVEPGGRPVGAGQRHAGEDAGAPAEPAGDRDADPGAGRGVLVEPGADALTQDGAGQVEAGLRLRLDRVEVVVEPVAQDAELQRVEDPVHRLTVPAPPAQLLGLDRQVEVVDQVVDLVVAHDAGQVGAQTVADLALDLVDVRDDAVQVAELVDPLGGGLVADARDAGQVVAVLADQCRLHPIERRRNAVALLDLGRGHAVHLRHAALEIEHGDQVGDQLERVAVAGDDRRRHAVGARPGRPGSR